MELSDDGATRRWSDETMERRDDGVTRRWSDETMERRDRETGRQGELHPPHYCDEFSLRGFNASRLR